MAFTLEAKTDLALRRAFDIFFKELLSSFTSAGMHVGRTGPRRITLDGEIVGSFVTWSPGKRARLEWLAGSGLAKGKARVDFAFRALGKGSAVKVSFSGREGDMGEGPESIGWLVGEVVAPASAKLTARSVGDWVTDRMARKPSGPRSRRVYGDPVFHRPNFMAILERLKLRRSDYLLDVGCGGGAFLKEALKSGCRAGAIDHSLEMVQLARRKNIRAIGSGRLDIKHADAEHIPYGDGIFSCAVMTGVFGFIDEPLDVLREINRVLAPGGRLFLYTGTQQLRGTPAAPEPVASRLHFYSDSQLEGMALRCGFRTAVVERPVMQKYLDRAKIPLGARPLFQNRYGQLLDARK
jgi:ubiquinone/menaquinone biosynthesis C-methylase UbiE